jgi:hemoglobin-like flavoprotein
MTASTLTSRQLELVRESFGRLVPIAGAAGALIYERIFVLAPQTRVLFDDDISEQAVRLMQAVGRAVESLDRPEEVREFLERLGARHVRYGVVPAHFDVLTDAVTWALGEGLGEAFTSEVREAWEIVCATVAEAMVAGMTATSAVAV